MSGLKCFEKPKVWFSKAGDWHRASISCHLKTRRNARPVGWVQLDGTGQTKGDALRALAKKAKEIAKG